MKKRIPYFKLKGKLVAMGYNKPEIKSMVSQIKSFDKDLKQSMYYWIVDDMIPGDADPDMMIGDYSIRNIVQKFGYSVPAAFAILQTYRNDPDKAYQLLYRVPSKPNVEELSEEKMKELFERWEIQEEEIPEDQSDVVINDDSEEEK